MKENKNQSFKPRENNPPDTITRSFLDNYYSTITINYVMAKKVEEERDYQSGARIIRVTPSQLPDGVLGQYHSTTHTIYILNNLSANDENFVRHHESGHAQGIFDESRADSYSSSRSGYYLRILGNPYLTRR